jgi:enoyl-[acyl-carrier protein] reductase/trans-2-enoyl-CoA reductase (NAD+)
MRPEVQAQVRQGWGEVRSENLGELADMQGFREEFLRHHGFGMPGIDYSQPVDPTRVE